jgi:hypothetical protein
MQYHNIDYMIHCINVKHQTSEQNLSVCAYTASLLKSGRVMKVNKPGYEYVKMITTCQGKSMTTTK